MDRARIKTFILLLLLSVNLVFAAMLAIDFAEAARQRAETRAELVRALDRMGITIAPGAIPDDAPQAIYFSERADQLHAESVLVTAVLGDSWGVPEGGGIFRWESRAGVGQTRQGSFWFALEPQIHPIADTGYLLDQMGLIACAGLQIDSSVTYTQSIEGRQIVNAQITFYFADGYISELSGSALWGGRRHYTVENQQDITTALIALAGHLRDNGTVSRFFDVEMGYYLLEGPGYLELLPVWIVGTDGGTFSIDRQSGEIRK
ncbi:MAG: hypothetical protein FWE12_08365 [Oscillospiraceae bacterium]|nr:hypothetical protein [Oscillospiraceae bacterium]